jgi:CheY-like chemotaxis protein
MDLQMPVMNGFETTDYIRKYYSKNSIIALTADVTIADLAKCKSVGMNDYIAKPVDERLLYNKNESYQEIVEKSNEIKTRDKFKNKKKFNLEYLTRTKSKINDGNDRCIFTANTNHLK